MKKPWGWVAVGGAVLVPLLAVLVARRGRSIPPRPATVPAAAEWAGRGASGRFFLVEGRRDVTYTIHVYEAGRGTEAATVRWRLVGFARTSIGADEIAGLEGGAILLKDGSRLLPVP